MSELVALAYPDRQVAEVVRDILGDLESQDAIELEDAVIAARDRRGRLKLEQLHRHGRSGAAAGGVAGAVVGLLVAAPLLGAVVVGAAGGGFAASRHDTGVDDTFAKELAATLEPPRAALVLLVREATADRVLPEIREYGGQVLRTSLSEEAEARLRARLVDGDAPSPPAS
jgi:uncharacterized membrane protein